MSLARAFAYAGTPATVTSLWKISDESTFQIMIDFYKNLKSNENKDAALRQAKLDYLDKTLEPELAHPKFWAGFVVHGNIAPLTLTALKDHLLWLLITLGAITLLWLDIKRK